MGNTEEFELALREGEAVPPHAVFGGCCPPRAALVAATAAIFGGFARRGTPSACNGSGRELGAETCQLGPCRI